MNVRVGVLVVTHGGSGGALLASVTKLLGPDATVSMDTVEVPPEETRDTTLSRVHAAVAVLDGGRGVLILCDLIGSTPANCCLDEMRNHDGRDIHVLSGLSLPMLIKVASTDRRRATADDLAEAALQTALAAVKHIGG